MKKVLIITNLVYATPRIPWVVKYLPKFGWEPIILTPPIGKDLVHYFGSYNDINKYTTVVTGNFSESPWPKEDIFIRINKMVKNRLSFLESLYYIFYKNLYNSIIHYPDREKQWAHSAIMAGSKILEKGNITAIISSSPPVTSHIIANRLKIKYNIPWIADLRDLWSQNHNYPYNLVRRELDKRLELKTLKLADSLVMVSSPCAKKLKNLHKVNKVHTIPTGFDPDEFMKQDKLTKKFTITYTGQIYQGKQDPTKLLLVVKALIMKGIIDKKDIEVGFYGPIDNRLTKKIKEYALKDIVKQYGIIPRNLSLKKQRGSHVLLLLKWEDKKEKGVFTLKLFEYLAAKRPILATGSFKGDVIDKLLRETKAGYSCSTLNEIENIITRLYLDYKKNGKTNYKGDIMRVNKYSCEEMARRFANVLGKVEKRC
ncbi:MAG: glycosyltransferase [Nanoarchaeota archaeon]